MKRPLVIFTHGGGRLGNQLLNFAHLIGWIEEKLVKVELVNMAFWDYAGFFKGTKSNILCRYPKPEKNNKFWQVARALRINKYINTVKLDRRRIVKYLFDTQTIKCSYETPIDLGKKSFNEKINESRITFLSGWGLRNWEFFRKHQQTIREFFRPISSIEGAASSFVQSIRSKYNLLIGVLIRQDDYRIWADGKYYFETGAYIAWMKSVVDMFQPQRVGFIISTDEEQNEQEFHGLNYHMATGAKGKGGHYLESLMELSLCDLIISPPSTFSAWAAFMGNKPLLPLLKPNQCISPNIILSEHIFEAYNHPEFSASVH